MMTKSELKRMIKEAVTEALEPEAGKSKAYSRAIKFLTDNGNSRSPLPLDTEDDIQNAIAHLSMEIMLCQPHLCSQFVLSEFRKAIEDYKANNQ